MSNPFIPTNYNSRTMNPFSENFNANLTQLYFNSKNKKKNASTSPIGSANSFKTASPGSPMRASVGTQKRTKTARSRKVSVVTKPKDFKAEARKSKRVIVIIPKNPVGYKIIRA